MYFFILFSVLFSSEVHYIFYYYRSTLYHGGSCFTRMSLFLLCLLSPMLVTFLIIPHVIFLLFTLLLVPRFTVISLLSMNFIYKFVIFYSAFACFPFIKKSFNITYYQIVLRSFNKLSNIFLPVKQTFSYIHYFFLVCRRYILLFIFTLIPTFSPAFLLFTNILRNRSSSAWSIYFSSTFSV